EARRPFLQPALAARNFSPSDPRDETSPSHSIFFIAMKGNPATKKEGKDTVNPMTQLKRISILPLLIALGLVVGSTPERATDPSAAPVTYWSNEARRAIVPPGPNNI